MNLLKIFFFSIDQFFLRLFFFNLTLKKNSCCNSSFSVSATPVSKNKAFAKQQSLAQSVNMSPATMDLRATDDINNKYLSTVDTIDKAMIIQGWEPAAVYVFGDKSNLKVRLRKEPFRNRHQGPYDLQRQPQRRRWLKGDVNFSIQKSQGSLTTVFETCSMTSRMLQHC